MTIEEENNMTNIVEKLILQLIVAIIENIDAEMYEAIKAELESLE